MAGRHELPKAELHVHLEGSVTPDLMRELAPAVSAEEIRGRFGFRSFAGFLECYKWVVEHLRCPEDYALVARRLLASLAQQHVCYAEITLSAGVVLWKKQEFAPIYDALQPEAAASAVAVRWNLDAIRHFGAEQAMQVAELAAERVGKGVVSFGIGGDEVRGPAEWFTQVYKFAKASGLRLTAHAGETAGPESVWAALRLGAERIGHGIRAVDDPALVQHLRGHNIPLEVCISSNVATGAVESLRAHPVRRLYDAGVPIVLNTDDPGLFNTTLEREYDLAGREFGFSETELAQIVENGFRYAFAPVDAPA
ncbi:MAG TPA: adenosine deaminase [Bryobacteraceae bacterium]|nr:adenosine deaminase [Bryobacteraceae bacterium]